MADPVSIITAVGTVVGVVVYELYKKFSTAKTPPAPTVSTTLVLGQGDVQRVSPGASQLPVVDQVQARATQPSTPSLAAILCEDCPVRRLHAELRRDHAELRAQFEELKRLFEAHVAWHAADLAARNKAEMEDAVERAKNDTSLAAIIERIRERLDEQDRDLHLSSYVRSGHDKR